MYRLVIVDDEPLIREGLVKHINWSKCGFEVVADFDDGSGALDYMRNNLVDVVLTDIIMCDVDGMELCRRMWMEYPHVRVVLLSGHRQFEYAKEAMKYNVFDYLLKPIKQEEIEQTFTTLKQEMDKAADEFVSNSERDILSHSVQDMLKSVFFLQLFHDNSLTANELLWYLYISSVPVHLVSDNIYFYELTPKSRGNVVAPQMERLCRLLHTELVADRYTYSHMVSIDGEQGVMIVFAGSEQSAALTAKRSAEVIRTEANLEVEMQLVSKQEPILRLLHGADYDEFVSSNEVLKNDYVQLLNKYHLFTLCFVLNNREGANKLTDKLFVKLQGIRSSDRQFLLRSLLWLILLSPNLSPQFVQALKETVAYEDFADESLAEMHFREAVDKVFHIFTDAETIDVDPIIAKVKRYVTQHISDDISIGVVSQQVYFNPAYFGRYFKSRTGETFNEYLVRIRMQKAIEIMKTQHCKIDEISAQIGYDTKYFFSVFKRYTGYRPMEYYRQFIQNG